MSRIQEKKIISLHSYKVFIGHSE